MICLSCNIWRTKLVFPIFKTVPIDYIAKNSTNKNRIAHFINDDNKTARIPIGGICKKCAQKGVAKEYNSKVGWRTAFRQWLNRPR